MLAYCLFALTLVAGVFAGEPHLELEPAFTMRAGIEPGITTGPVHKGYTITFVNSPNGTIVSAPDAKTTINATILGGDDLIHIDPQGGNFRLDVRGVAKYIPPPSLPPRNQTSIFKFGYTGVAIPSEEMTKALTRQPDSKTTEFGNIQTHHTFETPVAATDLAGLSNDQFMGMGRILVNPDRSVTVEYVVSRVVIVK
ncbi:unnamed protein product [Tuber aestivum]|uniref:Uncharacterized protein n=1 Tax=Tuber aestivum TaxID=59557 RepID=A0A292PSE4_9PEZI|nr:unnamed protein product [Tuber aestivum]